MDLSKQNILDGRINADHVQVPGRSVFDFPEKVIQFGTGVLLRGLPDYFIDKANKQGLFRGRIVVVKSTDAGDTDSFRRQDNLYTLCIRGVDKGKEINEQVINASLSRVLHARDEWSGVLDCASNPDLQIVISNTTEVGIVLTEDNIFDDPPASFPGKLLAFLYKRYQVFRGDPSGGLVIVPAELIPDNGKVLAEILLKLADFNTLGNAFKEWLTSHNFICNSLVDRIVPGRLPEEERISVEQKLGYEDALMIMAEFYCLWAIESPSDKVKKVLSFCGADDGVFVTDNIDKYRGLKMRLLNGTHTFSCAPALLAGFSTVKEAMGDKMMSGFMEQMMNKEIVPAIVGDKISLEEAMLFSQKVIDRFRNPCIEHQWLSITVQYSSKMRMRNVPILQMHYDKSRDVPRYMAFSFAAYLYFMRLTRKGDLFQATLNGRICPVKDAEASILYEHWKEDSPSRVALSVLQDRRLWGADLTLLPGFARTVTGYLKEMISSSCADVMAGLVKAYRES